MGHYRDTIEQLQALDNFQKAEFLKRREIYSECKIRIAGMRERTHALHRKISTDAEFYKKANSWFWLVSVTALLLQVIFNILPNEFLVGLVIVAGMMWGGGFVIKRIDENHNKMMFDILALEIDRYEFDLQVNSSISGRGLNGVEDELLTKSILEGLGFDSGLIGSAEKIHPLDPID
jgi:hypothetical protein